MLLLTYICRLATAQFHHDDAQQRRRAVGLRWAFHLSCFTVTAYHCMLRRSRRWRPSLTYSHDHLGTGDLSNGCQAILVAYTRWRPGLTRGNNLGFVIDTGDELAIIIVSRALEEAAIRPTGGSDMPQYA